MASTSDSELDYLSPSFDPSSLTVPRLRSVLVSHDISYPASAKKSQLIDIFTSELVPKSRKILAARARARRTSKGITDMPSSQGSTVDGDEDEIAKIMAPPPVPESSRRKSRKSRASTEDGPGELSSKSRVLGNGRASTKHARTSDSDATPEVETKRPLARKTRKSETTPDVRTEEPDQPIVRPPLRESAFSDENPFQSGSSPPPPSEDRRKSANRSGDRRKTSSRRTTQRTASPGPSVKKEDGVAVPSSKTFEMSVAALKKPKIKQEPDDSVETGEEFTPEEQLELVRSRAANGERDIFGPRRKRASRRSSGVSRSAPWVVIMTIMIGFATWWRREKLEIGYCGVGRPSTALENVQLPEWITGLQPECEPCPQHAYCYSGMEARCEPNFVRKPHPLSLGGLIPLPPSCEPDGDKVRKIKSVADRAVEELRERRAKWECGDLVNEQGKDVQTVGIDAADLKTEVGKKRRRGMSEEEFEDLWKGALGEIIGRDEVTSETDG
ncbi:inner nuclear membrane protein enriched at telomere/subtelomere region [Loxospora ochrophaea]|nr:inner nuclear membrane protein enriched at telomere/subtelomere region [Loxospora ochrophaea]